MRKYAILALLAIVPTFAARLTLRDGTVVYGQFVSGTSQNIIFRDDNGVQRRFDVNQIQGIDFSGVTTAAGQYNDNRIDNRNDNRRNDQYPQQRIGGSDNNNNNNNNTAYRDDNRHR